MSSFENTHLWQSTLAKQLAPDLHEKEREFLRSNYESFREKAGVLAAEINRDLPDYTVHDLTHLDALWEMASIISGKDYPLNPAEAFVLGGAFLIHDLGMGLAAYPDGINDLKNSPLWDDTFASLSKNNSDTSEVEKETVGIVLRALHAKHAEKLAQISWDNDGVSHYLIDNNELREAYGPIIGLVAHSHWWPAEDIEKCLAKFLGAFEKLPNEWIIDPIKLACIMRVSDASHIDTRRAPSILKAFRQPNKFASEHWLFQQKLYQPRLENERLVYSSKTSFSQTEFNSWWLCYDTLKMIDRELRDVDSILADLSKPRLLAKGVAAIHNIKHLIRLIGTDNWLPVSTEVHVGDVAKLVKNLGGQQLYGDDSVVPLRELIQNANDAIRARRYLEDECDDWGKVTVRTGCDSKGHYIEVEDNGVGMSVNVLTGAFLDFGTSFWGTTTMHSEFPGLESKGYYSTGKYGVGFFSTFMWGDSVSVATRRYEDGRDSTKILSFEYGLHSRPILRNANPEEYLKDGGTRIRVYFTDKRKYEQLFTTKGYEPTKRELDELLLDLCPMLDVNLYAENDCQKPKITVRANDWLSITGDDFVRRSLGSSYYNRLTKAMLDRLKHLANEVSTVEEDGIIVGRAFISPFNMYHPKEHIPIYGCVSVGGFRTSGLRNIVGMFPGFTERASREVAKPLLNTKSLNSLFEKEVKRADKEQYIENEQMQIASTVRGLGGDIQSLCFGADKNGAINIESFVDKVKSLDSDIVLVFKSSVDRGNRLSGKLVLNDNVFLTDVGVPETLNSQSNSRSWISWPPNESNRFHSRSLHGIFIDELAKLWGCTPEELEENSKNSEGGDRHECLIGSIDGQDYIIDGAYIIKRPVLL
ncbi:ATP-binding protein [Vibrio splendidus]